MVTGFGFGGSSLPQNSGVGQREQRIGPLAESVIANRPVLVLRRVLGERAPTRNLAIQLYFSK